MRYIRGREQGIVWDLYLADRLLGITDEPMQLAIQLCLKQLKG